MRKVKIEIITNPIDIERLKSIAESQFGDMVKAVVDIEKEIMAIAGELHADEEAELLADRRWKTRLKEIARTRELLCAAVYGPDIYRASLDDLNNILG